MAPAHGRIANVVDIQATYETRGVRRLVMADLAVKLADGAIWDMRAQDLRSIELRRYDRPAALNRVVAILAGQVVIDAYETVVVLVAITAIHIGSASSIFGRAVMALHETILVIGGHRGSTACFVRAVICR